MNLDDAQDVVDAWFDSEGDAALHNGVTPCAVVLHRRGHLARGAEPISFHGTAMTVGVAALDILVRASEIAVPAEGDVFTLVENGVAFTVGEAPMTEDTHALVWRCATNSPEPSA